MTRASTCMRKAIGSIVFLLVALLVPDTWAQSKYRVLHTFDGSGGEERPVAGLVMDATGNLYGTTSGNFNDIPGTVFKLTPEPDGNWRESILYTFCSATGCADG